MKAASTEAVSNSYMKSYVIGTYSVLTLTVSVGDCQLNYEASTPKT